MHWSAVPPPVANKPLWRGLQLIALTAAWWSENLSRGLSDVADQMKSLLSFPPEASWFSSCKLHLNPHTSCLCSVSFMYDLPDALKSLTNIDLSLLPEATTDGVTLFQANEDTLAEWPCIVLTFRLWLMSQIYTSPVFVPTDRWFPLYDQLKEVIWSSSPTSHNS